MFFNPAYKLLFEQTAQVLQQLVQIRIGTAGATRIAGVFTGTAGATRTAGVFTGAAGATRIAGVFTGTAGFGVTRACTYCCSCY